MQLRMQINHFVVPKLFAEGVCRPKRKKNNTFKSYSICYNVPKTNPCPNVLLVTQAQTEPDSLLHSDDLFALFHRFQTVLEVIMPRTCLNLLRSGHVIQHTHKQVFPVDGGSPPGECAVILTRKTMTNLNNVLRFITNLSRRIPSNTSG